MAITLLDMLLEAGMITPAQCDEALQNRVFFGGRIGTNLVELDFLEEETLALFLSRKLAVPYVEPDRLLHLPAEAIGLIPRDLALKYHVIPLGFNGRRLSLAMADPSDLRAIDEIAFITGWIVNPLICPEVRMIQALGRYYQGEVEDRYRQLVLRLEEREQRAAVAAGESHGLASLPEVPEEAEVTFFDQTAGISPEKGAPPPRGGGNRRWIEQVDRFSVDQVRHTLATAEDREEIAENIVSYLSQEFERVALFLVRGEVASGWKARAGKKSLDGFPLLRIPLFHPSVLNTGAEDQAYYLGPVADTFWNTRLLEELDCQRPETVLVLPITILERRVGLLYLQGKSLPLPSRIGELKKLLAKAEQAFEILILRDKILMG